MSSKAEKTLNHSHQQSRLNIFFRSPLLLKIVAWLGSISFLGSTGMALAEIKAPSITRSDAQELIQASASPLPSSGTGTVTAEDQETYGPSVPVAQTPSPIQLNLAQLLGREVPVAVAPADAAILPTGTIVRPQHADILTAKNYTIGVNESATAPIEREGLSTISAPATQPSSMPGPSRGLINITDSQVQPESVISKSTPKTSIQPKSSAGQSVNGYRSVPTVASIPTLNSKLQHPDRLSGSIPTARTATPQPRFIPQVVPLAGLRSTAVKPMKPSVTAPAAPTAAATTPAPAMVTSSPFQSQQSVQIVVPAPKTGRIEVQSVAQLPLLSETKTVPTVPSIPSVRPAAVMASQAQSTTAFVNLGANESAVELGYPLSNPAPTTSRFGWRTHPITGSRRFHSGVDIGAPTGAPVVAAATGVVVSSGWQGGYGKAIVIQHNGVQQTLYGHLSEIFVQPGQRIDRGTVIGRVGSTGNSTGPHLHFESKVATSDGWVAIDPGEEIKYALENLRRSAPFAQRDLPPGYN